MRHRLKNFLYFALSMKIIFLTAHKRAFGTSNSIERAYDILEIKNIIYNT